MLKIIVVDDELPIRQWLEFCIKKLDGYEVVGTAAHGAKGFSLFRRLSPDIVITDIRMPVMDGLEMLGMIRNVNPTVYAIILTSHEDFGYARKAMSLGAVEYILKTEISDESLKSVLAKAAAAIGTELSDNSSRRLEGIANRNHFLRSFVLAGQKTELTESMLAEYNIPLKKAPYYAVNLYLSDGSCFRNRRTDADCFDNPVKILLDDNNVMLIGNVKERFRNSTSSSREACLACIRSIQERHACYIGLSDLSDDPSGLVRMMIQAYYRTRKSFYQPQRKIFDTEDISVSKPTNGERYKIMFSKELINQNYNGAAAIRKQMMAENRAEQPVDINYVKDLNVFFVTSLLHVTMEDIKALETEVKEVENLAEQCRTLEQLEQVIDRIFYENSQFNRKYAEYSSVVRKAIAYLEENYAGPITQPEVADFVGISSEYLSRIFKEETSVNFVVYLNNLRLKHALRLLETTNLKVYEVAEQVGYSNLSYFSTIFKKNFGQNPFEYKNNHARVK